MSHDRTHCELVEAKERMNGLEGKLVHAQKQLKDDGVVLHRNIQELQAMLAEKENAHQCELNRLSGMSNTNWSDFDNHPRHDIQLDNKNSNMMQPPPPPPSLQQADFGRNEANLQSSSQSKLQSEAAARCADAGDYDESDNRSPDSISSNDMATHLQQTLTEENKKKLEEATSQHHDKVASQNVSRASQSTDTIYNSEDGMSSFNQFLCDADAKLDEALQLTEEELIVTVKNALTHPVSKQGTTTTLREKNDENAQDAKEEVKVQRVVADLVGSDEENLEMFCAMVKSTTPHVATSYDHGEQVTGKVFDGAITTFEMMLKEILAVEDDDVEDDDDGFM